MLLELRISHLVLVDELVIPFRDGLTVLTGETGAGKSLIAGALSLLCGGKADRSLVRQGEDLAFVEAVFDLTGRPELLEKVARAGVRVAHDGILVLRRELRRQGRSRVVVNGLVSSLVVLEQIGPALLSVQSQDQQRELADPDFARRLLDEQVGCGPLLSELGDHLAEFRRLGQSLRVREQEDALAREQLDLWQYQHRELSQAGLAPGEEEELQEAVALKRNAHALQEGAGEALQRLAEGPGAAREAVGQALSALQGPAASSRRLGQILADLELVSEGLNEAVLELNRFLDGLDLDPGDLQDLEARKALYEELRRKYRLDTAGLLRLQEKLALQIGRQESAAGDMTELGRELDTVREKLQVSARKLHKSRLKGAPGVAERAAAKIRVLNLPDLELCFHFQPREAGDGPVTVENVPCQVKNDGTDRIQLQVRTNPGEGMGPVAAVASGGERSRIHLGLKVLQERQEGAPLWLFDEIDAGLGMDNAQPVALLLQQLARAGQVICITHLPTMAVFGDHHLQVSKQVRDGRTVLHLVQLAEQERVAEVARLLGGEGFEKGDWAAQRTYAVELLRTARGSGPASKQQSLSG